jgi:hypothetical protein
MPAKSGNPAYFAHKSREDLLKANRFVAWGQGDDGSVCFMEAPLEVQTSRVG